MAFLVRRYLPWLAGLNLLWEIAQLPLYTIWSDRGAGQIVFAVVHCTLGDIAIGASALALALIATRAGAVSEWRWNAVAALATLLGFAYTAFSEWLNTTVLHGWSYSRLMPTLSMGEIEFGASPLAQWLLVPPLALWLARRRAPSM